MVGEGEMEGGGGGRHELHGFVHERPPFERLFISVTVFISFFLCPQKELRKYTTN